MEVWIVLSYLCVAVYLGLVCAFSLIMEQQNRKAELDAKWERFYQWKEEETHGGYSSSRMAE